MLDTGVDYNVAELGGGTFPNAKVIGGSDIGDDDDDPIDCEGHGTSVAAIAAGPTGVAPDATIVALKVFPQERNQLRRLADDSDILAAVDWAIRTGRLRIGAINLSLGGAPTDGLATDTATTIYRRYVRPSTRPTRPGSSSSSLPATTGLDNAIAAPACISNAVSVGAVYPDTLRPVAWSDDSGGTLCTDSSVAPDTSSASPTRPRTSPCSRPATSGSSPPGAGPNILPRDVRLEPGRCGSRSP